MSQNKRQNIIQRLLTWITLWLIFFQSLVTRPWTNPLASKPPTNIKPIMSNAMCQTEPAALEPCMMIQTQEILDSMDRAMLKIHFENWLSNSLEIYLEEKMTHWSLEKTLNDLKRWSLKGIDLETCNKLKKNFIIYRLLTIVSNIEILQKIESEPNYTTQEGTPSSSKTFFEEIEAWEIGFATELSAILAEEDDNDEDYTDKGNTLDIYEITFTYDNMIQLLRDKIDEILEASYPLFKKSDRIHENIQSTLHLLDEPDKEIHDLIQKLETIDLGQDAKQIANILH